MKKIISIFIACIIFTLVGCAGDSDGHEDEAKTSTDEKSSKTVEQSTNGTSVKNNQEILTVKNNEDFAAVLTVKDPLDPIVGEFAKKYAGKTIEFDGNIASMMQHGDYTTRFDILIYAGDYSETTAIGPSFKFEDVNVFDLNLTGSEIPENIGEGQNFHITASVEEYNETSGLFFLKPISTEIRYKKEMTEKVTKTTKTPEVTEASGVSSGSTVSGFDTKTNKTITLGGIDFSLPSYFDVLDKGSMETWMHYYPEEEDYYVSIVFESKEFLGTQEDFNSKVPSIVNSILDSNNKELQKSEKISIAGLPGWTIKYTESSKGDGVISTGIESFVYNRNTGKIVIVSCFYDSIDKSQYDYLGDYKKVLETAKLLTE
jgi:hypothetical protein